MIALLLLWVQQQPHEAAWWTSDQMRTALIGIITALVGAATAMGRLALKVMWEVRDDVRDMKRDIHGKDGKNGIKSDVRLLVRRVDTIEDWKIAEQAVEEAERQHYQGPDRRAGPRRIREVIEEGHLEKMRRMTDEYTSEE